MASMMELRRDITLNEPHLETLTGDGIVTFNTDMDAELKECKLSFAPIQAGSGTPSPENVRAISGQDSIRLFACGKNLVPSDDPANPDKYYTHNSTGKCAYSSEENGFYNNGSGVSYAVHTKKKGYQVSTYFQAPKNMTVVFSAEYKGTPTTTYGLRVYVNGTNTNNLGRLSDGEWHTLTKSITFSKGGGMGLIGYGGAYWRNLQVEEGSSFTGYEPYQGSVLDFDFPSTLYGGTLDVLTGAVKSEWGYIASYDGETLPGEWISSMDTYTEGATPSTGAQVAYKLATPQTYQLSPNTIKTLKGLNNVWHNANGEIALKYWTH